MLLLSAEQMLRTSSPSLSFSVTLFFSRHECTLPLHKCISAHTVCVYGYARVCNFISLLQSSFCSSTELCPGQYGHPFSCLVVYFFLLQDMMFPQRIVLSLDRFALVWLLHSWPSVGGTFSMSKSWCPCESMHAKCRVWLWFDCFYVQAEEICTSDLSDQLH